MGSGYAILLWDYWGAGLVRVNPRLLTDGVDMYGNPNNWFPGDFTEEEIMSKHNLTYEDLFEIIR